MTQVLTDKKAFMAQYWGQQAMKETLFPNSPICEVSSTFIDEFDGWHLELYSLDDITDEDSIELCKILQIKTDYPEIAGRSRAHWVGKVDPKSSSCNSIAIDFLRSRSYLVPYLRYSVEQLISMGWVKIRKRNEHN